MDPRSARSLVQAAVILLIIGIVSPAPSLGIFMLGLAGLCALFPVLLGSGGTRVGAAIALIISLGLAVVKYPEFQAEQARYLDRAKSQKR